MSQCGNNNALAHHHVPCDRLLQKAYWIVSCRINTPGKWILHYFLALTVWLRAESKGVGGRDLGGKSSPFSENEVLCFIDVLNFILFESFSKTSVVPNFMFLELWPQNCLPLLKILDLLRLFIRTIQPWIVQEKQSFSLQLQHLRHPYRFPLQ